MFGWLGPPWRLVEGAWGAVAGATTATVRAVGPLLSLGGGDKTTTPKTRPLVSSLPLALPLPLPYLSLSILLFPYLSLTLYLVLVGGW